MKALYIFAPTLMVLFFASGAAFGAFGDVLDSYEIGEESHKFYQPISISYGDGYLWILESKAEKTGSYPNYHYFLKFYKCKVVTTNGTSFDIVEEFYIKWISESDLNGFCYVTESSKEFLWTAKTNDNQLWQLEIYGNDIPIYRSLKLPDGYYPTGITLDNNLNIYFIDAIKRKVYKILYGDYSGISAYGTGDIAEGDISELFTLTGSPSIPMGIEYAGGIPGKVYVTLAGEHDYIKKFNVSGLQLDSVEISDPDYPDDTISYMPVDLTLDSQGNIWFCDDDWDILYKVEGSSQ